MTRSTELELTPTVLVELSQDSIDALADAIAQRFRLEVYRPSQRFVSAGEIAAQIGRTAAWVRAHRHELGAIAIGDGIRPRLLFDPQEVAKRVAARSESERSQPPREPVAAGQRPMRRRVRSGTRAELLPFRGSDRLAEAPD